MDVAYYHTSPGFRDHCSRLTGVLEFWTAPYPTQCPASAIDSYDRRLILLSSNRFEPSFLGAESRLTQQTPAVRCTAGCRFAIRLDRFLKARALTSQVRLDAQFGPVSNLRTARRGTRYLTGHSIWSQCVCFESEVIVRLFLDCHALQTHDQTY